MHEGVPSKFPLNLHVIVSEPTNVKPLLQLTLYDSPCNTAAVGGVTVPLITVGLLQVTLSERSIEE